MDVTIATPHAAASHAAKHANPHGHKASGQAEDNADPFAAMLAALLGTDVTQAEPTAIDLPAANEAATSCLPGGKCSPFSALPQGTTASSPQAQGNPVTATPTAELAATTTTAALTGKTPSIVAQASSTPASFTPAATQHADAHPTPIPDTAAATAAPQPRPTAPASTTTSPLAAASGGAATSIPAPTPAAQPPSLPAETAAVTNAQLPSTQAKTQEPPAPTVAAHVQSTVPQGNAKPDQRVTAPVARLATSDSAGNAGSASAAATVTPATSSAADTTSTAATAQNLDAATRNNRMRDARATPPAVQRAVAPDAVTAETTVGSAPSEAAETGTQPTTTERGATSVPIQQPAAAAKLAEQVSYMAQRDLQHATIQVEPGELGPIQIRVTLGSQDQLQIQFSAAQAQTREALDGHLPRLREALAESGFNALNVDVSGQQGQQRQAAANYAQDGWRQPAAMYPQQREDAPQLTEAPFVTPPQRVGQSDRLDVFA